MIAPAEPPPTPARKDSPPPPPLPPAVVSTGVLPWGLAGALGVVLSRPLKLCAAPWDVPLVLPELSVPLLVVSLGMRKPRGALPLGGEGDTVDVALEPNEVLGASAVATLAMVSAAVRQHRPLSHHLPVSLSRPRSLPALPASGRRQGWHTTFPGRRDGGACGLA